MLHDSFKLPFCAYFCFHLYRLEMEKHASCNFCVSCGQKKKLLTVSSSSPEELLTNLKSKICDQVFSSNEAYLYTMKLKMEQFQTYVDIDEEDMDDVNLMRDGGSIILEPITSSQSPQRSTGANVIQLSPEDGYVQCSTDVSTSPPFKEAKVPAKSPSLKVKVIYLLLW